MVWKGKIRALAGILAATADVHAGDIERVPELPSDSNNASDSVDLAARRSGPAKQQAQSAPNYVFSTSASGIADLSTWPDAKGLNGLAAADQVCRTAAERAQLPDAENYIAWMSDSENDAYCRAAGLEGKRDDNCDQAQPVEDAGPWLLFGDQVFAGGLAELTVLGGPRRPLRLDDTGAEETLPLFTGTDSEGRSTDEHCADWTSDLGFAAAGRVELTNFGWSNASSIPCDFVSSLFCIAQGDFGPNVAETEDTARKVFVTRETGTGNLGSWSGAGAEVGIDAADAVCRGEAAAANLDYADSYKAWISDQWNSPQNRFRDGLPWERTDGVNFKSSLTASAETSISVDAFGHRIDTGSAYTGTSGFGYPDRSGYCFNWFGDLPMDRAGAGSLSSVSSWSSTTSGVFFGSPFFPGCQEHRHLYCFSDGPSLIQTIFFDGFE